MKIELLVDLPITKDAGATKGRVFEVTDQEREKMFFVGDNGDRCAAFAYEYEIVEGNE